MCEGSLGGWMAGMVIVSLLIGVGLLTLLIIGVVAALRWLGRTANPGISGDTALAILRERYARGEINREEFEARRQDLSTR